jgi:hypothetical protein
MRKDDMREMRRNARKRVINDLPYIKLHIPKQVTIK